MITSISAKVIEVGAGFVTFNLHGLGVQVMVPSGSRAPSLHAGSDGFLHTAFIVREDSMTLYGFETADELEVFHHLLTVTGIGPKSALGVLSALTPTEIANAATNEDEKAFRVVSGVGPKTAKLLIINLSGKLKHLAGGAPQKTAAPQSTVDVEQVLSGLIGLGWQEQKARQAILLADEELKSAGVSAKQADLLRVALKNLQAKK